jgi:YVTN family beta-propeller protein
MNLKRSLIGSVCAVMSFASGAIAQPANSYRIYVTNELSGDLSIIDGQTRGVIATVPLGKRPRGIQASPDGKRLYIALSGSPVAGPGVDETTLPPADKSADGIGVFDTATNSLVSVIKGVSDPEQLAVSPNGARLYVASEDEALAVVFDLRRGERIAGIPVGGQPEGVAISPDGRFAYVTSETDSQVSVIDTRSNKRVGQFPSGARPRSVVFSADGKQAFVSSENDGRIAFVATRVHRPTGSMQLVGDAVRPMGLAASKDGSTLFVVTGRGGTLVKIDVPSATVQQTVAVGKRPWGVALSPDERQVITANGPSNDVTIVDVQTMQVVQKIAVGRGPWGVVVARSDVP